MKKPDKNKPVDFGALRERIRLEIKNLRQSYLQIGRLLLEAKKLKAWKVWGFKHFADYVATELSLSVTEAGQHMSFARMVSELAISDEEFVSFGKTNIIQLHCLNQEGREVAVGLLRQGVRGSDFAQRVKQTFFEQQRRSPIPISERLKAKSLGFHRTVMFKNAAEYKEFADLIGFCSQIIDSEFPGTLVVSLLRAKVQAIKASSKIAV